MLVVMAAQAEAGGMPQFNAEFYTSQLFWLAVSFLALYLILSRVALPRIGEVIEERRDRIQRDLDEAERMKGETEQALAAYDQALTDARGRAQGIAKESRDRLALSVEQEKATVEAQLAQKIAETERRIAETKTRALASVGEIAADTVGSIVGRLVGTEPTHEEVQRALSAAATSGTAR